MSTAYRYGRQYDDLAVLPFCEYAEHVIFSTYGDAVSVDAKNKQLSKFGQNLAVGTTYETVAELQSTESNETFVTTNIIDSIVSSSSSDTTQTIAIEGHTVDVSGNMTFVTQDAVLTGQTEVTLTTPMARANRAFVKPTGTFGSTPAALVGNVSIYDNTGGVSAGGVPTVASATKLIISAGEAQTAKAATTISKNDYWLITYFSAGIGNAGGNAARVTVRMETRDIVNGGAWRPMSAEIVLVVGQNEQFITFPTPLIVPKNHDWRIVAKANSNTAEIFAQAGGVLALLIE